jgi:putative intracellular protease/amidase
MPKASALEMSMEVAILIFDRLTALDAVGPYEVLVNITGVKVSFVGEQRGLVRTRHRSLALEADFAISEIKHADVLVVAGGIGEEVVRSKLAMLE